MFIIPQTRVIQDLGVFLVEALVDSEEQEHAQLVLLQGLSLPPGKKILLYRRNWLHLPGDMRREPSFPRKSPMIYEAGITCSQRETCMLRLHKSNKHTPFRVNGRYLSLSSYPQYRLTPGDILQIGANITLRYDSLSLHFA